MIDFSVPSLAVSTVVTTVLGVEDNVPVIQPGILHGYINENSPLGTPVLDTSSGQPLAVVASNTDASGSGGGSGSGACAVHFSINLAQSVPFEIDATTGNIYSSGSLDWEAHPKPYLVQVRARYLAGTGLFSNPALINISLVNVYDGESVVRLSEYTLCLFFPPPMHHTAIA